MRDKARDGDGNLLSQQEHLHPRKFHATNGGLAGGWKIEAPKCNNRAVHQMRDGDDKYQGRGAEERGERAPPPP